MDVFDNLIDRQSPPGDPARIAAVISLRVVAELFRTPPLGKACKRLRRPMQKSRDAAAMLNIAAEKQS
jgi:hypothetical protein